MILLCGIPTETPIAMVRDELDQLNAPYIVFHQRCFDTMELEFEISGDCVRGEIKIAGEGYPLAEIDGVYARLMDHQLLPELRDAPANSPRRRYCRALHDALMHWYEIMPGRVVNRTRPMGSNFSKPYQTQLIRNHGFEIPETLITNDPECVLAFRARFGRVIYKSISGVRSIVRTLEEKDLERLDQIRWCPVQFQEFVEGTNVRVHTVDTEVFATAIHTDATDYRYAHRQSGKEAELQAIELSDALSERCIGLSRALGLPFAGIDLKMTPDGRVFCFEVNPSPAFSYYESGTGQPIARAVARYLVGRETGCVFR